MRALVLALAFAAPISAVAATPMMIPTPTYASALNSTRHAKQDVVFITFVNYTAQDRELLVGNQEYKMPFFSKMHVYLPVGSPVFVYSETNSKVNGQELMRVSAKDMDRNIFLK